MALEVCDELLSKTMWMESELSMLFSISSKNPMKCNESLRSISQRLTP